MNRRQTTIVCLFSVIGFVIACLLSACNVSLTSQHRIEKKTMPLVLQKDKDKPAAQSEMNLYFVDGSDVPYVALSEYMPLYGSFYEDEDHDTEAVEYTIEHNGKMTSASRIDNGFSMNVEPAASRISFESYDGFLQTPGDPNLVGIVGIGADGFGGRSKLLVDSGTSYNRDGLLTELDLAKYSIALYDIDGECYLPLQTMNDILLAHHYYRTVYNGDKVFIFAYGSDLNEDILSAERGEMSQTYAEFNLNELAFLVDNFYGLKSEHKIDDVYKFFADAGLLGDLASTDPNVFDKALAALTARYFDDLHSGITTRSVGTEAPEEGESEQEAMYDLMREVAGASVTSGYEAGDYYENTRERHLKDAVANAGEDGPFLYEEVGDTAIVTFDTFKVDKNDYRKEADLDNPQDTIELIAKAHREITRKGSPIKNVVLDLSNNGGGDADAAGFVISWFAGPRRIAMRNTQTGAQTICSYVSDVNLDGKFDDKDTLYNKAMAGKLNLYCLTSSKSFSCGNLVPATFKGTGCIKLIGETTGGGSCIVLPCTSASGAQFQISGTSQISTIKNGSFYNTDTGIDPDFPIAKVDTYYDRNQLVDLIHNTK